MDTVFRLNVRFGVFYWGLEYDSMDVSFGSLGLSHHGVMHDALLSRSRSREGGGCWALHVLGVEMFI